MLKRLIHKTLLPLILVLFVSNIYANVTLPRLISDGMVLQQGVDLKIWGWATPGEQVKVQFINDEYNTTTGENGQWYVMVPAQNTGGPYDLMVSATNEIIVKDILIGEVWVAGGQSNMELPMRRVSWKYPEEIQNCQNNQIRIFTVPQKYSFNAPLDNLESGSWESTNPVTIMNFSAVAYFYAKELFNQYKVPVGIINASLGGSPVESWMSEPALKKYPHYYNELQTLKDQNYIDSIVTSDNKRINAWYNLSTKKDEGNGAVPWKDNKTDLSTWKAIDIPGYWTNTELENTNGVIWFKKNFSLEKTEAKQESLLNLGCIVDADSVFINGVFIGNTTYRYPPRRYNIPKGILKTGENIITIRVISNSGTGGFVPDKDYQIEGAVSDIDLSGKWLYRIGTTMEPLRGQTFIRWKPAGLYNAMIAPLLNYRIKGAIWYQGESNTGNPEEYTHTFPEMIGDWRKNFDQGDFPFLYVQLANFMEAKEQPEESSWAELRNAQLQSLSVPNTGMAVTIDIGEWNDIHPLNKSEVGRRLSLLARKTAYHEDGLIASGPIYNNMKILGDTIAISFTETGSGLNTKNNNPLKEFAIAGNDSIFYWANATIKNNKIYVWCPKVKNPVMARYAWADNPDKSNFINNEGLPASPFTTEASATKNKRKENKTGFIIVLAGLIFLLLFLFRRYQQKPARQ